MSRPARDFTDPPAGFSSTKYHELSRWSGAQWSKQILRRVHLKAAIDIILEGHPSDSQEARSSKFPEVAGRIQALMNRPGNIPDSSSTVPDRPDLELTRHPSFRPLTINDLVNTLQAVKHWANTHDQSLEDVGKLSLQQLVIAYGLDLMPFELCAVTTCVTKGQLRTEMAEWFSEKKTRVVQADRESIEAWVDYAVIPYIDLKIIFSWTGVATLNEEIATMLNRLEPILWAKVEPTRTEGYAKKLLTLSSSRRLADVQQY